MEPVRSQRKLIVNDVVSTLPLYRSAPALEVRLEEFELFALDRLRGNSYLLNNFCKFRFRARVYFVQKFGAVFALIFVWFLRKCRKGERIFWC